MKDLRREANPVRERIDCERTRQIAAYVSTWLRERFYSRAELDRFLMRHPFYELYRDALLRECRLSCIACVLIALRMAHRGTDFVAEFVDYMQKQSVRPGNKRKGMRDIQIPALTGEEVTKIADYVKVHQYISLKARNADWAGSSIVHSCVTSIGYLTVTSVMTQGSAGYDEFGSTVHLLHELVAPLLRSALESTLRAFGARSGIDSGWVGSTDRIKLG